QATDYFLLPAGDYTVGVNIAGEATPVVEAPVTLAAGDALTAVALGPGDALELSAFHDDLAPLDLGTGRLVVINASAELEAVDIVTADGATLIGGVGQGKASAPADLSADAYDLDIVATGGDGTALP